MCMLCVCARAHRGTTQLLRGRLVLENPHGPPLEAGAQHCAAMVSYAGGGATLAEALKATLAARERLPAAHRCLLLLATRVPKRAEPALAGAHVLCVRVAPPMPAKALLLQPPVHDAARDEMPAGGAVCETIHNRL
eukprot:scaffold99429_cov36-Phaeocystis_antarctica.AAC.2